MLVQDLQERFQALKKRIETADTFAAIMSSIESDMLQILEAERLTVYKWARNGKEMTSSVKSGDTTSEIRVGLSTSSISGYVALSRQPVIINDVHDAEELKRIHPNLSFSDRYDKALGFSSGSMVVVPITQGDSLLGVLQVINSSGGRIFERNDMMGASAVAQLIGAKFGHEFQITKGPYHYLVLQGKITADKLADVERRVVKGKLSLAALLMQEARLSIAEIGGSLERYYQVPFLEFEADKLTFGDLAKNISEVYLKSNLWVPVSGDKTEAVVLIDNPNDYSRIMEIERVLGVRHLVFRVGIPEHIHRYIDVLFGKGSSSTDVGLDAIIGKLSEADGVEMLEDAQDGGGEEGANDSTIVQLVNQIIVEAYKAGASDIHIEPSKEGMAANVRIRVDGLCRNLLTIPANRIREVVARIKVTCRLDISERRKPQDGKCKVRIRDKTVELRVATVPTVHGESAVMRILAQGGVLPLEKLNLSARNFSQVEKLVSHPHGLILVVGPTGSGKTTTLHALLGRLNTEVRKIWTAEDPVEITQPGLQQVQVAPKIGFTFADAMRSFLRADPDVVLIGEMRDKETAHIGVEASLTGHLVLSTLHTNSAPETITRLLDLGLDPFSFSDAMLGVLAQRLMRTICVKCKEAYKPPVTEVEFLIKTYGADIFPELGVAKDDLMLHRGKGCEHCGGTGYRGRTGIHELLVGSDELRRLIYTNAGVTKIREQAIKEGMRTLLQDGIAKVVGGMSDMTQLHMVATR